VFNDTTTDDSTRKGNLAFSLNIDLEKTPDMDLVSRAGL
jgi:hypothetical protein